MHNQPANPQLLLIVLWIAVLFNMIFADIFSIMVEFINGGVIDIPLDVLTMMGIAAIITNIPILMVVLTWVLPYKVNRWTNVIAAIITIIYVVGGGTLLPHYIIMAGIEIVLLIIVILVASQWEFVHV